MKTGKLVILGVFAFCLISQAAGAAYNLYSRKGSIDIGFGVGLTTNPPVRFNMQYNGQYFWTSNVSFGMDIDLFFRGPTTFVFQPFARYHFDINRHPSIVPYIGGGIGGGVDSNANGVFDILLPGFGFTFELTRNLYVGSDMGFHILINGGGASPDFHILFGTISYRF